MQMVVDHNASQHHPRGDRRSQVCFKHVLDMHPSLARPFHQRGRNNETDMAMPYFPLPDCDPRAGCLCAHFSTTL
jgi:hypothetical protein